MHKHEALDAIALGIGQLDRFGNDFSNIELSQLDNFSTQLKNATARARAGNRVKKPVCFGSNPNAQHQAENDCHTCDFQKECFNQPAPKTQYIAIDIEDKCIKYDGVVIYTGDVGKMGIKAIMQIVASHKADITPKNIEKIAEAIYTAGAKKGWYLDSDVTRALAKTAIAAMQEN